MHLRPMWKRFATRKPRPVLRRAVLALRGESGAITVEYALCMLLAAAILMGVEPEIFRPMAKEIFNEFMGFIAKPYP